MHAALMPRPQANSTLTQIATCFVAEWYSARRIEPGGHAVRLVDCEKLFLDVIKNELRHLKHGHAFAPVEHFPQLVVRFD